GHPSALVGCNHSLGLRSPSSFCIPARNKLRSTPPLAIPAHRLFGPCPSARARHIESEGISELAMEKHGDLLHRRFCLELTQERPDHALVLVTWPVGVGHDADRIPRVDETSQLAEARAQLCLAESQPSQVQYLWMPHAGAKRRRRERHQCCRDGRLAPPSAPTIR